MGVADKVRRKQMELRAASSGRTEATSHQDSPAGSSLAVVDDQPHIDRLKGVIAMLRRAIEENNDGSGLARFAFLMTAFTDEMAEEFRDMDPLTMRVYLFQVGAMIAWIGHGENEQLPESVRAFAELIQPTSRNSIQKVNHAS
jgi:hypothetical protein